MVGTPRIRCQENGKWNAPKPKCIREYLMWDKEYTNFYYLTMLGRQMNR